MCRAGTNEVVAIDFGWAVKESDKTYENHAWAKNYPGLLTYEDMKVFHDHLLAHHFLDPKDPNRTKIIKPILEKNRKTRNDLANRQKAKLKK
jgi:hypothetical protein